MKHRGTTKPSKDKKKFTTSAATIKKVNISPKVSRGGIRM